MDTINKEIAERSGIRALAAGFGLFCLLLSLILSDQLLGAEKADSSLTPAPIVRSIEFEGKFKLRRFILQREIDTRIGQPLDTLLLLRDQRKIEGFRLFSIVQPRLEVDGDSVDIIYHLKEVWTLWPLLSVSRSDESFDWLVGVREKDLLGLYLRTSLFYRRYEGENSYGSSAQFPRAFGRDLAFGWNLGESRQVDPLTFADSTTGIEQTADYRYLSKYLWFNAGLRLQERLYLRGAVGYQRENWSLKNERDLPAGGLPVYDYPRYMLAGSATFGRVYFDNFFLEGNDLTFGAMLINEQPAGDFDQWRFSLSGRSYRILGPFNLALRGQYGTSSADERIAPYYISGVANVRGFEDKIERGDHLAAANLEIRLRGFESSTFYTQLALFSDAGAVWGRGRDFPTAIESAYLSVGVGLRLAIRKFIGRIGRVDIARDTRTGNWKYYLSANQFF